MTRHAFSSRRGGSGSENNKQHHLRDLRAFICAQYICLSLIHSYISRAKDETYISRAKDETALLYGLP
jgi:hypothetical protein